MTDRKKRIKELDNRLTKLFDKLVPSEGPADTLEGEMIRAINKTIYRYFNDGDYWYEGYGCETAGPCVAFLCSTDCPIWSQLEPHFNDSEAYDYEDCLYDVAEKIAEYVETRKELTKNEFDMLDYDSKYDEEYDDWCNYYDDDEY